MSPNYRIERRVSDKVPSSSVGCRGAHAERSAALGIGLDMKVREVIRLLEQDGWRHVRTSGSHRQFRHTVKSGTVTVAGKLGVDVPIGTLNSILKQSGLKRQ